VSDIEEMEKILLELKEEVRRLRVESSEETAHHEKLRDILTRTANALKGEPAPLTQHSWHDLPEVAERLHNDLRLARGAMAAQDERERVAGDRCGVSYLDHGCDWPDAVADVVVTLRDALAKEPEVKP
jgi:hypothetical protein